MENTINNNIIEIYKKAYDLCLKCKFQQSYDLIKDIADKYEIPFYPVLCLNLETYGYYKHLNKSNLIKIESDKCTIINKEFKKTCENARHACDVAYDFTYNLAISGVFNEQDPNALVDLAQLKENMDAANHFAAQNLWGLARKYIIKSMRIFSGDFGMWVAYAKTYLEQPLCAGYIEGIVALKQALELEKEYLKEDTGPWAIHDFDLHYTLIKFYILLKEYGLEQPLEIRNELKILESCKRTPEQEYKIKELKSEIVIAEQNSKFSYEEILNADHNTPNTSSTYNNKSQTQNRNNQNDGCYVATAVYGSYDCPQVWTLRRYRDYTLAETWYGRTFIKLYYLISPTIVKWFGDTKWFKKMWQGKLDHMVAKLQDRGVESTPYEDKEW